MSVAIAFTEIYLTSTI